MSSLVRPELEEDSVEIKGPKRGRPRLNVAKLSKNETRQNEPLKQSKPEDVIKFIYIQFFLSVKH